MAAPAFAADGQGQHAQGAAHLNQVEGSPTSTVSFVPTPPNNNGYFAIRGLASTINIPIQASAPATAGFSVPTTVLFMQTTNAVFAPGGTLATSGIANPGNNGPGIYTIHLGTPSTPNVGTASPTTTTLELRTYPPTIEDTMGPHANGFGPMSFCAVICIYQSFCGSYSGRGVPAARTGISAPSEFGDFTEITTLQDFRDDILATSAAGRAFISLYDHFGFELGLKLFANPTFFGQFKDAKDAWIPAVDSLVNDDGSYVLSASMITAMNQTFDHFRVYGSPQLRVAIDTWYDWLRPDLFQGHTIKELADHWAAMTPPLFKDGFEDR